MAYVETEPEAEMHCIIDGHWGIYIPQEFATRGMAERWGVSAKDIEILTAGPDHEFYWDAWDDVTREATFTDENGKVWSLEQDGDLFAACYA